ncbi:hypothetical protein N0V90_007227 [Kalmusia sp. IMI 367209]|nr:hypothetical protein N0V90_007227 [Kalmusia sp. IMI 367209]
MRGSKIAMQKDTYKEYTMAHTRHNSAGVGPKVLTVDTQEDLADAQGLSRNRGDSVETAIGSFKSHVRNDCNIGNGHKSCNSTQNEKDLLLKLDTVSRELGHKTASVLNLESRLKWTTYQLEEVTLAKDKMEESYNLQSDLLDRFSNRYGNAFGRSLTELDRSVKGFKRMIDHLASEARHTSDLRTQVKLLQTELFANVEKVETVSDDTFAKDFRILASAIKSLSRSVDIPDKIHVLDIDFIRPGILVADVDKRSLKTRQHKKAIVEAFIWSMLINDVFSTPSSIWGRKYAAYFVGWTQIFGDGHANRSPIPTELAERWRYTTVERLVEMSGNEVITDGLVGDNEIDMQESILQARKDTIDHILATLQTLSPGVPLMQIPDIIDKAFSLALQMALRRCRVQIVIPKIGEQYVLGETSHLRSVLDNEDIEEGNVAFIVKPGLAKWGDAHGKKLDQRCEIVPAEVFVTEPPKKVLAEMPDKEAVVKALSNNALGLLSDCSGDDVAT